MKKKTEETPQDICKAFLKKVIVDETQIGTKKFRNDLYNRLIKYGIWNNYDFCKTLNKDDFITKSGYKKTDDIDRVYEIQKTVKEQHFK